MDRTQIIALWLLHRRRKRRKQNRLYWVHPLNQRRDEAGIFNVLFKHLRNDENKFFDFFRMSVCSFDELHAKLQNVLQRQNTNLRNCINPIEMLSMTLRYLGSGCTFTQLHQSFRVGTSTARKIVKEVCAAIWSVMREECIPTPTGDSWQSHASNFEMTANLPHCVGAVDGKLIKLACSTDSIVVMAVADAAYRFLHVDVGSYGKECDSSIFKTSALWTSIEDGSRPLPEEQLLPGTETMMPYFFVGDEAFGLHKHLLRPFGGKLLTVEKRVFNYRLGRARRFVECAFGILSNKWRVFHRPVNVNADFAVGIVRACVVLHNYVRDRDGYIAEDAMTVTGLDDLARENAVRGGLAANHVRNVLCQYFMTEAGSVHWQMSKI